MTSGWLTDGSSENSCEHTKRWVKVDQEPISQEGQHQDRVFRIRPRLLSNLLQYVGPLLHSYCSPPAIRAILGREHWNLQRDQYFAYFTIGRNLEFQEWFF